TQLAAPLLHLRHQLGNPFDPRSPRVDALLDLAFEFRPGRPGVIRGSAPIERDVSAVSPDQDDVLGNSPGWLAAVTALGRALGHQGERQGFWGVLGFVDADQVGRAFRFSVAHLLPFPGPGIVARWQRLNYHTRRQKNSPPSCDGPGGSATEG